MAKSRARYLAELLNSSGRVKKDKSDLTGGDNEIDLDSLPTITNAKLQNSSIGVAGHTVSLGGSVSLDTADITEHTDYKYYTDTRVRGAVSVSGDLSYNSITGVISYTTPTTIASLSNHDTDDLSEGVSNLYFTNERVDDRVNALLSAGTGITLTYDDANNTLTIAGSAQYGDSDARAAISVSGSLSYNSTTGVISYTTPTTIASLSNHDTGDLAEGTNLYYTNARADARITAALIDEDSFATNSATRLPSQQSVKAYVDAQVAGVVDSAPAALNTLNELAAALGDDANFSTTTSTALGNRLRVDTASQGLTGTQQANALTNLGITATKAELNYVDGVTSNIQTQLDGKQASGSYLTGNQTITLSGDASGSGTTSIVVTVADDSHNHVISNVDGLQTALDTKATKSYWPDATTRLGLTTHSLSTFSSTANYSQPAGYQTMLQNSGSSGTPGGQSYYGYTITSRRDTGGGYSALATAYDNSALWFTYNTVSTSYPTWRKVWSEVDFTSTNVSNWNTAYGWGNHASAGYSTFSGSYNDLTNKPTIPTNNNQLTNGAGYLTSSSTALDSRYYTETEVNNLLAGYISTSSTQSNNIFIRGASPTIYLRDTDNISSMIHQNSNLFYILRADAADDTGWTTYSTSDGANGRWPLEINLTNSGHYFNIGSTNVTAGGNTVWHAGHFANNSSNWNTAYGWGNHASAGYITSTADRTPLDHIRSLGTTAFTGTNTTAGFISEMESDGAFDSYSSVFKTSWSYAGNFDISDAGSYGPTETAGMSFLTWTDNSSDSTRGNITLLAIAPNTGGSAGRTFIYNDQGSSYSPGWREIWTSRRMGSGTGLDSDLLDGQHGSYYLNYNNLSNKPTIPTNNNQLTNGAGYITASDGSITNKVPLAGGSMSGELNITYNTGITGSSAPSYSNGQIEVQTSGNHVPAIGFHRGGYSATTLYEYDGELYTNAWTTRAQTGKLISSGNYSSYAVPLSGGAMSGQLTTPSIITTAHQSTAVRWDTSFYVLQSQHWYGHTGSQTMYLGESGNPVRLRGTLHVGSDTSAPSSYKMSVTGNMTMNDSHLHYCNDVHGNTARFDSYQDKGGSFLFRTGSVSGTTRHLNLWNSTGDPSQADNPAGTGITWGQRTDSNPYYIIYPDKENVNGDYSKLVIAWHTGIKIGASNSYGGTRFYNNSPFTGGEILSVGNGDNHTRLASGCKLLFNGNSTYGIGAGGHNLNSGYFDTVESGLSGDTLELVYYSGAGVNVGQTGSKPLGCSEIRFNANTTNRKIDSTSAFYSTHAGVRIYGNWNEFEVMGRVLDVSGSNCHFMDGYGSTNHAAHYLRIGTGGGGNGGLDHVHIGCNLNVAGNVTAYYSDARLKQNVETIPNALEILKGIRGVTFEWNKKAEGVWNKKEGEKDFGMIAQEVDKVFPMGTIVQGNADRNKEIGYADPNSPNYDPLHNGELDEPEYKTVKYDKMVTLAIQAIKEQQEIIERLTRRIDELENKGE